MIKTLNLALALGILLAVIGLVVVLQQPQQTLGSVITGGEYRHTEVVDATSGTSTLQKRHGSLGSIIVENTSAAAVFVLYDTASTTIATSSATQLLSFDVSAGEGTYQYDVRFVNGLMLDVGTAFDGDVVVTYR